MYHYVENKEFLKEAHELCRKILNKVVGILLNKGISSQAVLVGSGGRNMVTQNGNGDVDFDFNLLIQKCNFIKDCKRIKNIVRKACNEVMKSFGYQDVKDSTSCITTCKMSLKEYQNIKFSIDLCVVRKDEDDAWHRLIHDKASNPQKDRYFWNIAPNSSAIASKAQRIKKAGAWSKVRQRYLEIKNRYLKKQDTNHLSFICYIEAVNEIYNELFGKH